MRRLFTAFTFFFIAFQAFAAINAQYNFENSLPGFIAVNGNGNASVSGEKFKDGKHSVKFEWSSPAELVFNNFSDIEASMKVNGSGLMMWVYNPVPMEEPIRFTFYDWTGKEICHFDFNASFKGWRAIWMKYIDMLTPEGHYGDKKLSERNTAAAKMTITPPSCCESGVLYIDRVSFPTKKLHDQITPDQQIPQNNYNLQRDMWQWCRLWEWEQYEPLPKEKMTPEKEQMLRTVEQRMDEWAATGNPGKEYTAGTLMKRLSGHLDKYGIRRLEDGSVTGAPLLSDDEFNNGLGEMRIRFIQEIVYWSALDYLYTGNTSNIDMVINAMDHAIDQGFAYGSGQGTNHHYGYQVRDLYKGIWILRKPLQQRGKLEEYVRHLTYWSGLQEIRRPYEQTRDGILDAWHTLHNCRVISAMLQPSDQDKYTYMKGLGAWTSGSLMFTEGTVGGLKVDGTTFHHGGHYPGYSVGAFAVLGDYCFFTKDTDFAIDRTAREHFKFALMTLYDYTNGKDWGLGVCGRHPFNGRIPDPDVEAFARLAVLGDLTDAGKNVDPELAGAYIALQGKNKTYLSQFKKEGISASVQPDGFRVYNYGAFGIHRRNGWALTLKGFNSDVWGTEIYAADNRYGRYLAYGSVQLIGQDGAKASGYSQEGWDWNRIPGATTIHLPFDKLENPLKGTLMERNSSRFPGVSSLEGRNGCLAFTIVEGNRQNFCPGATATKSVFCFDNRIIFLGTGIGNNSSFPTETTLYQFHLEDKNAEIDINDEYTDAFPYSYRVTDRGQVVLTDTQKNIYIIKDGQGLVVEKKHQQSPLDTKKGNGEGDFVTAYLDHGVSPSQASYEYLMLVSPTGKETSKYSKKLPYKVLQADNSAHVVKDEPTGTTTYISYKGYSSDATLVSSILPETIVMERRREDGTVVMSICTPDLGITKKGYTTSQASQPLERTVTLNGVFSLQGENSSVQLTQADGKTIVKATCINGIPVEFILTK